MSVDWTYFSLSSVVENQDRACVRPGVMTGRCSMHVRTNVSPICDRFHEDESIE